MTLNENVKVQSYLKISKNIDIEKIIAKYPNISESDINMCISVNINYASDVINSELMSSVYGFKDMREVGESSLKILKKDFLDLGQYFYLNQKEFNNNFRVKRQQYGYEENYAENPFYFSKGVFDAQFENLEENSDLDICAKTLYWSNKAVKQVEAVKENVSSKIASNGKTSLRKLNRFENKCKLQFVDEERKENLRDEYISKYNAYLEGKISKEQLENEKSYVTMGKILQEQSENGLNVSPEEAFEYLSLSKNVRTLYMLKDSCIENIMSIYSKLKENEEERGELAVYHERETPDKKFLTEKTNSVILTILVKGTNTPIKVHCSPAFLSDIENCYSTLIPEGNIKLERKNLLYVKYSEKQKEEINKLNSLENKEELDYDVREYIENQYNMCNDLDKIKVKNRKKEIDDR